MHRAQDLQHLTSSPGTGGWENILCCCTHIAGIRQIFHRNADEALFDDIQDSDVDQDLVDSDQDLSDCGDELHAERTLDEPADAHSVLDSGYSSDRGSPLVADRELGRGTMEVDELSNPIPEGVNGPRVVESEEIQNWKLLCYEDICLWIVQNPKPGERDVLAMEVLLRHHKGADKKPKPYVPILFTHHRPN
jgi:hypothetical protein